MSILGWIFFGLITGFIASKVVNAHGQGCILNIVLGIVGAVVGGALFNFLGEPVFYHFSFKSMLIAILGAIVVLLVWNALTGRKGLR
ncbi:putative membrane protein YeaQ/YmgE (transglycosylase-associated protein family) [Rhizomicrobium palustre]|uniref:Putative membrane protein YeaQ/YmgE (Transglycosylase-associated protein family) n=1 Tax=Rhizomicrobium palustre TaxID=189966 RepID=A0A846N5G1_9PROT|nr:GlsB/YeaQ/YmgE family stress response membrane protein [Rhizomicrobium palustre]NIK90421.1 putative membrane protein YeaQ/YmgE (transglycosylase-associated protein family) [Rhizomicrobium palustre]